MSQHICLPETSSRWLTLTKLHHDLSAALNKLSSSEDHDFCNEYKHFVALAEQIFRREEEWMEEIDLSVFKEHLEQHANALCALHHVHRRVMEGEINLGREVADKLLPHWIAFHMSSMDEAFAHITQMALPESHQFAGPIAISAVGSLH